MMGQEETIRLLQECDGGVQMGNFPESESVILYYTLVQSRG